MAVANYHSAYGHLPPAFIADDNGAPMHSWRVLLLPFIEEHDLYERYNFNEPWNSQSNRRLAEEMPSMYAFHGEYSPGVVTTNYLAVVGNDTAWPGAALRKMNEIADGLSSTILIIENSGAGVHWMEPRDVDFDSMSFDVGAANGVSSNYLHPAIATLDDSVHQLSKDLAPELLRAALTINGGEPNSITDDSRWPFLADGRDRLRRDAETEP